MISINDLMTAMIHLEQEFDIFSDNIIGTPLEKQFDVLFKALFISKKILEEPTLIGFEVLNELEKNNVVIHSNKLDKM